MDLAKTELLLPRNLNAVLLFVDFSKAFDSIHRGKMEEILLAYGIPAEVVNAIMVLYKDTQAMVRSPDGDTEFFYTVAGVLQGDTIAPYLFIICLDYVLRTSVDKMKENGFTLKQTRSRRYPAVTITDVDYADDLALLADTIKQAESLLHSLEQEARGVGLCINSDKTEFMCFNQNGVIKSLNNKPLKMVDNFIYLGSNISSTESDVNIRIGKAWAAMKNLSIIWKSNLPNHMKCEFFQATVVSILLYGCTAWTLTKRLEKKLDGTYTKLLRAALNVSWKQHLTNKQLYGNLPAISHIIRERRTRFVGHCWREKDEIVSDVLLWTPKHGHSSKGRPHKTFIKQLCEDTKCNIEDLPRAMEDRKGWRKPFLEIRAISTPW